MKISAPAVCFTLLICFFADNRICYGSNPDFWHDTERSINYRPDGEDFVIANGSRRFNRAIYGSNSGFRIEAGDLPQFALYMPGMGGSLKFGLSAAGESKWLIHADSTVARYRPGSMLYRIRDHLIDEGSIDMTVLAIDKAEGLLVKLACSPEMNGSDLLCFFGGVSGKRFHRDGDIGADPESSFYLKPEYCRGNAYVIRDNTFDVTYNQNGRDGAKRLAAVFPPHSEIRLVDAENQDTPADFIGSEAHENPAVACRLQLKAGHEYYFAIYNPRSCELFAYRDIPGLFDQSERSRKQLAGRIQIDTPDPYINTLGGALSMAADAIWEYPSYLHGAVAWRSRLHGWRGIYAADPLGWHDRANTHFRAYAKSQYTSPANGPSVPDPDNNWARQQEKAGTALFTSGYISRRPGEISKPHHYDMNLVFIDALLRHFDWTGDIDLIKEMWPVLDRHFKWEKRCFDGNDDGLYDAYCCIWASDALQYSGGGVTHASAYNYRANKTAAKLAALIGQDPEPFRNEAGKIVNALRSELWMPDKGRFAEYKDLLGLKRIHPSAGLWTVYHAIDSDIADPFQAFQMLRYVDEEIPHIPVRAAGLPDESYYTLSTTNWQPYTWSINNVALAEILNTALAYWQTGRKEQAFKIWKSALLESMYLGSSPGNFQQLSFYDAFRGELYRDFADPVGVAARTVVEGLFGISPDLLNRMIRIRPGLPREWNHASLSTPDISFNFIREQNRDLVTVIPAFPKPLQLQFQQAAVMDSIKSVTVNGENGAWQNADPAIGNPLIDINCPAASQYHIVIEWGGLKPERPVLAEYYTADEPFQLGFDRAHVIEYSDPQKVWSDVEVSVKGLRAHIGAGCGRYTVFIKLKQGHLTWWEPLCFEVKHPLDIVASMDQEINQLIFQVTNYTSAVKKVKVVVNPGNRAFETDLSVQPNRSSREIHVPASHLVTGSNRIRIEYGEGQLIEQCVVCWEVNADKSQPWEEIDLASFFNDKVTRIFENRYISPRSPYPTLQTPIQGIGNWCSTRIKPDIDDSGLRRLAGDENQIVIPQGIPFATPGQADKNNIVFTSLWDNYPDSVVIPLSGYAGHAYFLMTGSTNPMQSQFTNGMITVEYADGREDCLPLRNPETWWPIEQDYFEDGFAFSLKKPKPVRVHLKTGYIGRDFNDYTSIPGFTTRAIEGGAAAVLDIPLDPLKELKQIKLKTSANEVVTGLMGITLMRDK
ncbi:DUF4450 domain-containing protein [bacterium]|nr:DUF4450 domain-containing protein [bacterium]